MSALPVPATGPDAAEEFVQQHFGHLTEPGTASPAFRGGQTAADAALAAYDVGGYAARRNEVWPPERRGASRLSPYIRHGLLGLSEVWDHVDGGPRRDVGKFRDELLWQEYARHWYARLGTRTRDGVRHRLPTRHGGDPAGAPSATGADLAAGWDRTLACLDLTIGELATDGWLVNQTRMWLAGHWTTRERLPWKDGEDHFFRHLLDGSRAANRLGWQWTTGAGSSRTYGFSRRQVERRAPGVCAGCALRADCPIERWPDDPDLVPVDRSPLLRSDPSPDDTAGPATVVTRVPPTHVWLTAESLGDRDPALVAEPELPAVFVFDEPLLSRLRLSAKRLIFLTETLAELATRREVELLLGDPVALLAGRAVAVTFAPVPGFRDRATAIDPAELHPWRWLRRPGSGSVASFTAWRRSLPR